MPEPQRSTIKPDRSDTEGHHPSAPGILTRHFDDAAELELDRTLQRLPGLKDSLRGQGLDIHKMDEICIFGYGSLTLKPHYPPTGSAVAYLEGYRREFCCKSLSSGTAERPGLTLGLDVAEGEAVKGVVHSFRGLSAQEKIRMLVAYADRESTPLAIYKFQALPVEKSDGKRVLAIVCVADSASPGYAGDMLTPQDRNTAGTPEERAALSLQKKAAVIAGSSGPKGTNKSYLDRFIGLDLIYGASAGASPSQAVVPEKFQEALARDRARMTELIQAVNAARAALPKSERETLEKQEQAQAVLFKKSWESLHNSSLSFKPGTPPPGPA